MKKMTKGAIVTGLGVALLLGGGGTLAVWNDSAVSQAGTIAAGDLDLQDPEVGVWTDGTGKKIEKIGDYRVVPGDTLTYTQTVTPILAGDKLKANLTVTGFDKITPYDSNEILISKPVLTNAANGTVQPDTVLTKADSNQPVTATTTFTFKADAKGNKLKSWDLSSIGYFLQQQDPTATPAPTPTS